MAKFYAKEKRDKKLNVKRFIFNPGLLQQL
jgi:hypothetical protein